MRVIRMGPGRPLLVLSDSHADESDPEDGASSPADPDVGRDDRLDVEPGDDLDAGPDVVVHGGAGLPAAGHC